MQSLERTYIDIAVCKVDGRYGIGAELKHRNEDYEIYKVASLYYDDVNIRSIHDVIQAVAPRLMDEVDKNTKIILFRSHIKHFAYRKMSLSNKWSILAHDKGFEGVKVRRIPKLHILNNDLQLLANDAINRKGDILATI